MKTLVTISLFIFWAVVTAILTAGLVFYQKPQTVSTPNNISASQSQQNQEVNPTTVIGGNLSFGENLSLSPEEVAKHNSAADCWVVIQDKVYDVSSYINLHPGNPEAIIPYCGKEATTAFETKNKNKPHSREAWNLLSDYYIGDLNQQLTSQNLQERSQKIQSSDLNLLTEKIMEEFPGGKIKKVKPKKGGIYEIKLIYNGVSYEVKIDSSGNILKIKTEED